MIMKESTSAAWLVEVNIRLAKLKKDPTNADQARELAAAANILCEELMHENGVKDGAAK